MSPEEFVKLIARQAEATAFLAGVGAMETAGSLVSCMANDPKFLAAFLDNPGEAMLSDRFDPRCNGCLSYCNSKGEIIDPQNFAEVRKPREVK